MIKQDTHTLDKTSIQRIQRYVQKLANAAQTSLAKCALLHDQNNILTRINDEAKVRRSTRSVILGKVKVMSYEDIEEARAKRTAKDAIKGKGKRGRKCKSNVLNADEPEAEAESEVACAETEVTKYSRKRGQKRKEAYEPEPEVARIISAPEPELESAQIISVPKLWRATVPRMI